MQDIFLGMGPRPGPWAWWPCPSRPTPLPRGPGPCQEMCLANVLLSAWDALARSMMVKCSCCKKSYTSEQWKCQCGKKWVECDLHRGCAPTIMQRRSQDQKKQKEKNSSEGKKGNRTLRRKKRKTKASEHVAVELRNHDKFTEANSLHANLKRRFAHLFIERCTGKRLCTEPHQVSAANGNAPT